MSEEETPKANSSGNDAALAKENARLAEQVAALQGQLKTISTERDSFKTATEQVNAKLTDFDAQMKALTTQVQAKDGELANWQTQHAQLNTQLGEVSGKNLELASKLSLVDMIAGNPDYHPVIGMFGTLSKIMRPDADPNDIKDLLDGQAATVKGAQQSTLDLFKAGGTVPGAGAAQPAQAGPKDMKEAWNLLQNLDPRAQRTEYKRVQDWIEKFEEARKSQPN